MLRIDDMQRQAVALLPEIWYNAFKRSIYLAKNCLSLKMLYFLVYYL